MSYWTNGQRTGFGNMRMSSYEARSLALAASCANSASAWRVPPTILATTLAITMRSTARRKIQIAVFAFIPRSAQIEPFRLTCQMNSIAGSVGWNRLAIPRFALCKTSWRHSKAVTMTSTHMARGSPITDFYTVTQVLAVNAMPHGFSTRLDRENRSRGKNMTASLPW